jgi:hypothetical protein
MDQEEAAIRVDKCAGYTHQKTEEAQVEIITMC